MHCADIRGRRKTEEGRGGNKRNVEEKERARREVGRDQRPASKFAVFPLEGTPSWLTLLIRAKRLHRSPK